MATTAADATLTYAQYLRPSRAMVDVRLSRGYSAPCGKMVAHAHLRERCTSQSAKEPPVCKLMLQGSPDDEAGQQPGLAHMHTKSKAALKDATRSQTRDSSPCTLRPFVSA
jgi:hypothetical protein